MGSQATMELQPVEQVAHQPVPFDYSTLPAEHAKLATDAATAINTSAKRIQGYYMAIGQKLAEVKEALDHGQFCAWVKAEFPWMTVRTAQRYMSAWTAFGDKSDTVSYLPPATVFDLAAPSTPLAVREQVVERLEAGERVGPAAVKGMIAEAKSRAAMAAQEAKIDATERERQARQAERRRKRKERLDRDWANEQREREQRQQAAEEMADQVVKLLKERLGDDFPAFIELAKRAGYYRIGKALGIPDGMF